MSAFIENLIHRGHYLDARAKAEEMLKTEPSLRVQQLYALALSKSGGSEAALAYLEPIHQSNPNDPETAGILGGIYKELFKKNQQTSFALKARDIYLKNFQATNNYYTGINAAAMSAMMMQASKSKEIARQVAQSIPANSTDFWETVTRAEAYLLTKEKLLAIEQYAKARRAVESDWGKIASVHNQLWLLNHYVQVPNEIFKLFAAPRVAAFSGHMIDQPDRATPRFPAAIEGKVKTAIAANIQSLNVQIGFCSLACGSDIIFAETLLELGGEVNVWLPFDANDFIETSVRFAGPQWLDRFTALMKKVPHTTITRQQYEGKNDLFGLLSKTIFGSAVLESNRYHNEPYLLSVLAENDRQMKEGGTRDSTLHWRFPNNRANVNPELFLSAHVDTTINKPLTRIPYSTRSVRYFVWMDLTNMPMLEKQKTEKTLTELQKTDAVEFQKAGQGIHLLAFLFEQEAISELRKILATVKKCIGWKMLLHAGPNIQQVSDEGMNILQAMNRLAVEGNAYSSRTFAALLKLNTDDFVIDYAGFLSSDAIETQMVYKISYSTANAN